MNVIIIMKQYTFSIVIPTFKRKEALSRTLRQLDIQKCNCDFEVIVINDGPAEELPELGFGKGTRANWRLIQNPHNLGRAATRNRGIKEATGEYVLMLDDDIWAVPGLVQAHYEKQKEIGGGVVVGAVPPAKEVEDTVWHRYIAARFARVHARLRQQELDFGLFLTGNVSLPANVLKEAGGFDERFKEYSFEDSELGYRLKTKGVRFAHAPDAIGYHFFTEDLKKICAKAQESGRSQAVFVKIHPELFNFMGSHSLVIRWWKKSEIIKNTGKLVLFSFVGMALSYRIAAIAGSLRMERIVFSSLPILEWQYKARGYGLGKKVVLT